MATFGLDSIVLSKGMEKVQHLTPNKTHFNTDIDNFID